MIRHDSPAAGLPAHFAWRYAGSAVAAAAILLFLIRLGDRAVVSEEVRWAQIAREMHASGDYLRPTINGRLYHDKPVGSYWLIVAASHLTGGVNETAARLPAALAGIVGVAVVLQLGRRLYDERTGVTAAAILTTSFGYCFYARRATADLETVTGVLLAVWWFARHEGRRAGPWIVGLWLGMAAVSLTKGLLGFALPVAVFSAYGLTTAWANRHERRFRPASILQANAWLFNRWSLAAVPLAVLVYLLPFLAATGADGENAGLAMVWRENVKRFVAPHNHLGPVYLYFGAIVVLAAPWSAFLPAALLPSAGRPTTRGDRLARVYFWVVFLVFTASASRRSYYLLPILPAAALLIGRLLTADRAALSRFALPLRRLAWVLFACGAALAGLVLLHPADVLPSPYDRLPPLPHRALAALGWLAALLAVAACVRRRAWCVPVALVGTFVAFGFSFGIVAPAVDDVRTRREFLRDVRKQTDGDPDRLGLYHAVDAVFDLDRNVADYGTPEELAAAASCGKLRWFVTPRRRFEELPFFPIVLLEEPMHAWEADDNRGNKLVLVQAILAPPGATR